MRLSRLLRFVILYMLLLLWTAWTAALLKVFNAWAVLAIGTLATIPAWRFLSKRTLFPRNPRSRRDAAILAAALAVIIAVTSLNVIFFHDALNGTRDEGIYANQAIYLARHGSLPGPGYRGWDIRLFLNTAWNALLYGTMGYNGLRLCNAIPFAIALLLIFLLTTELSEDPRAGLFAVVLISLSYPFLWYTRRTVNEVLFLFLFWSSAYFLYHCLKERATFKSDLVLFLLALPLAAFIRIEGLPVLAVGTLAWLYIYIRAHWHGRTIKPVALILVTLALVSCFFFAYTLLDRTYGIERVTKTSLGVGLGSGRVSDIERNAIYSNQAKYSIMVMIKFGFLPALLFIIPFFFLLLSQGRTRVFALFLALMAVPFAYFLLRPSISFDLPWFFRRFMTVLLPLALIAFSYTAFRLFKGASLLVAVAYLALLVSVSHPLLFHQEYRGVSSRVAEIASVASRGEKVLVDRYALGGYGLGAPLFFAHDLDIIEITPWKPVSLKDIGATGTFYLITNARTFHSQYRSGEMIFDDTVIVDSLEIEHEMDVRLEYIPPTCDFTSAGNYHTWSAMDWRIALSNIAVPREKMSEGYRLILVRMELDSAVQWFHQAGER